MRPHIGRIVTLWRTGLRLLCGRARYSPCSSKQRAHAVRLRAARSMQSNSIQSRTAARTVLVMQSRTALWCPHGPCGSVSARAMIVQAAPRADRAGCAVRASLSATRGDLSAAPPAAPGAIAPVQARRDHHRCCCGACSGWPLWLRRDRHRPGCRRRQARSAWPYQQCNLFQPLSGTAVQARSLPHADRLGELLGPKHTVKRLFPLLSPDLPSGSGRPGRARREAAAPRGIQFINLINIHD